MNFTVKGLENKAQKHLGKITSFLDELATAKDNAVALRTDASEQIETLKHVQKNCDTVTAFVDKIVK